MMHPIRNAHEPRLYILHTIIVLHVQSFPMKATIGKTGILIVPATNLPIPSTPKNEDTRLHPQHDTRLSETLTIPTIVLLKRLSRVTTARKNIIVTPLRRRPQHISEDVVDHPPGTGLDMPKLPHRHPSMFIPLAKDLQDTESD